MVGVSLGACNKYASAVRVGQILHFYEILWQPLCDLCSNSIWKCLIEGIQPPLTVRRDADRLGQDEVTVTEFGIDVVVARFPQKPAFQNRACAVGCLIDRRRNEVGTADHARVFCESLSEAPGRQQRQREPKHDAGNSGKKHLIHTQRRGIGSDCCASVDWVTLLAFRRFASSERKGNLGCGR